MDRNLIINSSSNPRFKDFYDVKENGKKKGLVLVEGEDLVDLAIKGQRIKEVITSDYSYKYASYKQTVISPELMKKLSSYNSVPPVMGIASYELGKELKEDGIIYLDGIQDPGNLGTIERSCLAFGYKTLVLSSDCVSPLNFKAVQASKGAFFNLNIVYLSLSQVKEKGYKLYMALLGGKDISSYKKPEGKYAIVIGNEGQGIRKENIALADEKILLPIDPVIDSLNAAIAASIIMFLWRKV
jgi:TrmH family RNA methyltransferase